MIDKEKVNEKNANHELAEDGLADAAGGGGMINGLNQMIAEVIDKTPLSSDPTLVSNAPHPRYEPGSCELEKMDGWFVGKIV